MRSCKHESRRSQLSRQRTRNWWERQLYALCNLGLMLAVIIVLVPTYVWEPLMKDPVGSVKQAVQTWDAGAFPLETRTDR